MKCPGFNVKLRTFSVTMVGNLIFGKSYNTFHRSPRPQFLTLKLVNSPLFVVWQETMLWPHRLDWLVLARHKTVIRMHQLYIESPRTCRYFDQTMENMSQTMLSPDEDSPANNHLLDVITTREAAVVMRSVSSVCPSVCLSCLYSDLWKSWRKNLIFCYAWAHLQS